MNFSTRRPLLTVAIILGSISAGSAVEEQTERSCFKVGRDAEKFVCVCSAQTCDDLHLEWPSEPGQKVLVETTRAGHRFRSRQLISERRLSDASAPGRQKSAEAPEAILSVNVSSRRQQILGWGGAFTDAAAINIKSLSGPLAKRLLEAYFGPKGLEYNFARVPIGGSDFSPRAYSYDDSPQPDLNLTQWALQPEDLEFKIPLIKQALEMAKGPDGISQLKLFASPWSPPRWMKTSNDFRRGHLIESDENYKSYANYLVKFYQAYREHGIEFWGATVQNEPISAYLPVYFFNSLQMNSAQTIKFVGQFLGPALEAFGLNKTNFKLMVGDDSLGFLNLQVPSVMRDKQVQRYVSGLAFHWYLSGLLVPYDTLTRVLAETSGTGLEFVMMSEACQGAFLSFTHVDLGDWSRGESYASDIIEDLKRRTGAWIDWNLALDTRGGPNWAGNFVDSPIIVDSAKDLFYKQPMYYALAHFSKLFRPDTSWLVDSNLTKGRLSGVTFVSALVVDTNHLVVNLLNKSNSKRTFTLQIEAGPTNGTRTVGNIQLEPKSVSSVVVKL